MPSDALTLALVGLIPSALTFLGTWLTMRGSSKTALDEQINKRINIILAERDKQVADRDKMILELKQKIEVLADHVETLLSAVRNALDVSDSCEVATEGGCPIVKSELAHSLSKAINVIALQNIKSHAGLSS